MLPIFIVLNVVYGFSKIREIGKSINSIAATYHEIHQSRMEALEILREAITSFDNTVTQITRDVLKHQKDHSIDTQSIAKEYETTISEAYKFYTSKDHSELLTNENSSSVLNHVNATLNHISSNNQIDRFNLHDHAKLRSAMNKSFGKSRFRRNLYILWAVLAIGLVLSYGYLLYKRFLLWEKRSVI